MLEEDIPPSPGPIRGTQGISPGRFISPHFQEQSDSLAIRDYLHNDNAREPDDMSNFTIGERTDHWWSSGHRWENIMIMSAREGMTRMEAFESNRQPKGSYSENRSIWIGPGYGGRRWAL
jgi:hypothetical protein